MSVERTPARKKARELAKYLRAEQPDYAYLKSVFYRTCIAAKHTWIAPMEAPRRPAPARVGYPQIAAT